MSLPSALKETNMVLMTGEKSRRWMLPTLIAAGAVILVLAGVVVWMFVTRPGDSPQPTPSPTSSATLTPTPTASVTPTPTPTSMPNPSPEPPAPQPVGPSAADIENIKAAIVTGNTQALVSHFTNPVMVILAASDGIGPSSPDDAAIFLAQRLGGKTGWNFDPTQAQLDSWRATFYEQYFPVGALVGFDAEGDTISLTFTGTQISTVFVAGLGDL
jgi:hypothetical protein